MKYQPQHDLIDPDVPAPDTGFVYEEDVDPDAPDDAYVIGEGGNSVNTVDLERSIAARTGLDRWAKPAALALIAVFVVLTAWNLSKVIQGPPPPPKPSPFHAKQALYLGVMRIDAFRKVHGAAPDTLEEAGLPEGGIYAYNRIGPARYTLSFVGSGSKLEYDSSVPKEQFFGSPKEMLTMGDSK